MKLSIDTDRISVLAAESGKIVLNAEADASLMQLLGLQESIEAAINEAKQRIEQEALALNPNFTSVTSDHFKIMYRSYGSRYKIDPAHLDDLPVDLYKVSKRYDVIPEAVEKYADEKGGLPLGIVVPDRPKTISIKPVGAKDVDES